MTTLTRGLLFSLAALWVTAPSQAETAATHPGDMASTPQARVIVKLRRPVVMTSEPTQTAGAAASFRERILKLGRRAGVSVDDAHQIGTALHAARARGMTSRELARRLALQSDVEYAVEDQRRHATQVIPNDPRFPGNQTTITPVVGQWYLRAPDGTMPSALNATGAWSVTTGNSSVVVAVLDTGIRYDHPDLKDRLLPGYNMISDGAIAGNGVGRTNDASDLGDWVTPQEIAANPAVFGNCTPQATSSWHGTQVAGVLGASTNNGIGMASVGRDIRVLPVRVLGKCGGYDSDIIAGMYWAAGISISGVPDNPNPARVLNLSLAGPGACTQVYVDVINALATQKSAVVVASAGNDAGFAVDTPANCPGVIGVAGLRNVGTKVGFSSLGPEVDISAPGGNCVNLSGACLYPIVTTTNSGSTTPVANSAAYTDSYDASLGTSFSAPMVAGTAALMLSAQPSLSPADIRSLMMSTSRPFPTTGGTPGTQACVAPSSTEQLECYCTTQTCGAGMLDAGAAVAAAAPVDRPVASLAMTPAQARPGLPVTFTASSSHTGPTAPGSSQFQWALISDGGIVTTLEGDLQSNTVTATPNATGTFQIRLTVTDALSRTSTIDQVVTVLNVAPLTVGTSSVSNARSDGGGGGGALDGPMLALLSLAALAATSPRRKHRV
ncbi:MAG TPA: S8 family serine peptidase [Aquabacterium sp.]|nr:S8 family serine peptidase [Aquabacterium sp.]